jgi:Transposase domain (DUF772)
MIHRAYLPRSLVEVLLPDADKLWDDELRAIDRILDDEAIVELVAEALRRRRPLSVIRGRLGTPVTVVLRLLILKHLYDWSFDECERVVRGSLVYRAFCRIDGERVPDAKTLIRLSQLLGPETLKPILERIVRLARQRRVTRGSRMRVDTTVVETNIHYPTDSSLLADGVRVLTRTMRRVATRVGDEALRGRDRTRSVARRVFEIVQRSRAAGRGTAAAQATRHARVTTLYREVMAITRAVVRDAEAVGRHLTAPRDEGIAKLGRRQSDCLNVFPGLAPRRAGDQRPGRAAQGSASGSRAEASRYLPRHRQSFGSARSYRPRRLVRGGTGRRSPWSGRRVRPRPGARRGSRRRAS